MTELLTFIGVCCMAAAGILALCGGLFIWPTKYIPFVAVLGAIGVVLWAFGAGR